MDENAARAEVAAAEARRCQAIADDDYATIAELLADEVHYRHSNGWADNKESFLASLQRRRRTCERGPLDVRLYGDTAVVLGSYHIVSSTRDGDASKDRHIHADGLQVWVRRDGRWQLVAHQGIPQSDAAPLGG